MNMNAFLDNLAMSIASFSMSKSKYFRESIVSPTFKEHLEAISMELPDITGEGFYEVKANTLVGELSSGFKIAQWKGESYPIIIYHHGVTELPFDLSFNKIFPYKKKEVPANLIVIRAPFHSSIKEFTNSIKELANYTAMLSVSTKLVEFLIQHYKKNTSNYIVVTGTSLGGFVTNLHHTYFNSADVYKPLLAGPCIGEVFLNGAYSKMTAPLAKGNPETIRRILNFSDDFAKVDNINVYPLLGLHDQIMDFEVQKKFYREESIVIIEKSHTTGATAYKELREHILGSLPSYKKS